MILCLDAGNSRLKYGLRQATTWLIQGALDYTALESLPRLLPALPQRLVACNVAGTDITKRLESLAAKWQLNVEWLRSTALCCGVTNSYVQPDRLGTDRWAALIGARAFHEGTAVVVLAGTATTIDVMDAGGVFRGGLILPGMRMMRAALARDTAGLPNACGHYMALPTTTDDAIVSGTIHATLGAIERMRVTMSMGSAMASVLLSGGAASELEAHIPSPCLKVENLVLEGLARHAGALD